MAVRRSEYDISRSSSFSDSLGSDDCDWSRSDGHLTCPWACAAERCDRDPDVVLDPLQRSAGRRRARFGPSDRRFHREDPPRL